MNALLLRVGIDKGCGGTLAPIFDDGSFEFVPIPESVSAPGALTYKQDWEEGEAPLSLRSVEHQECAESERKEAEGWQDPFTTPAPVHRLLDTFGTIVRACPSRP